MTGSPWLLPALILNTLAMVLVFGLSWLVLRQYPLPYFRWWVRGQGWSAVASIAGTAFGVATHLPWLSLLSIGSMTAISLCQMDTALAYRGRASARPWRWWLFGLMMLGSLGLVVAYGKLPEVFYLPAFLLLAVGQAMIAWAFWPRAGEAAGLGARVVAMVTGVWAVDSFFYPAVIGWQPAMLAPLTSLSGLLTITVGMGMIVHLLEQSLARERTLGHEVQEQNQALAQTLGELARTRSEAELYTTVAREQEALVRQIVHDLRNSTQALGLIAEAIEDEAAGNPRLQAHVGALERQLTFISNFLKQKLAWIVDRTAGRDPGTDVAPVFEALAQTFRPILASKGQRLEIEPPSAATPLRISPIELEQVLGNLLRNAHQHGPAGLTVRLWCAFSDGWATFYVADDGPGIPLALQATLGRGAPRQDGTGVGLRNVYHLVTLAGGSFGLVSSGAGGTTFHVALPLIAWGERGGPDQAPTQAGSSAILT